MTNLGVVFLTGLTTGGLSCLAVQSGLLASSIAYHTEQTVKQRLVMPLVAPNIDANPSAGTQYTSKKTRNKHTHRSAAMLRSQPVVVEHPKQRAATPIMVFLGSKLVTYTILGFLLGWLGSVLQLNPATRAVLQFAIGLFMVGTALRMLNVHPIFRYLVLEPPSAVTRYIRRKAKNRGSDLITPSLLGALTVFIPCGVTQAMMALAIGTGNALAGAAIMFAFTLGTSPVFFALAYLATRFGERLQTRFLTVAAVTVLLLGLFSVDTALNLMGSPVSVSSMLAVRAPASAVHSQPRNEQAPATVEEKQKTDGNIVTLNALDTGYEPKIVRAKASEPIRLNVMTNETYGCSRAFVIPALGIQKILPATGTTVIDLPPQSAGTLRFTCSMGMYGGQILVD